MMKIGGVYVLAGGAIAAALLYVYVRGAGQVGNDIGSAAVNTAVDLVDGVVTGGVVAIGEKVGIPKTNKTECECAIAEGRTWDASFACPASDFIKYLWK